MTDDKLRKMLAEATPGPWWVCEYDAGDYSWYDFNGPCPSIQAPEDQDCAIVHWDGFKQEYWSACNGDQKQIEANARLIAAAPDLAAEVLRLRDALRDALSALEYVRADITADRIAALEAAIYRVLNPAPGVRRIEPWAHGILSVALSSKPATAQCRMCGKTGLSTAEAGGPERIIGGEV